MVRLYSPSRLLPDTPHGRAFSLDAYDNGLQPMPLGVVWSQPLQADSGGSVPPSLQQLLM